MSAIPEQFLVDCLERGIDNNQAQMLRIAEMLKVVATSGECYPLDLGFYFGEFGARSNAVANTRRTLEEYRAMKEQDGQDS
jgi:hypothetical protein